MRRPLAMRPALLTAEDVAALLACSRKQVYRMANEGRIPALVLGDRMVRFDPAEIEAWIEASKRVRS